MELFCLMFSGIGLTNSVRTALFKTARKMFLEKERRSDLKTDDIEGVVTTDFAFTGIGSVYGLFFQAKIDTAQGSTGAEFIVRIRDLEFVDPDAGFWEASCDPQLIPRTSAEKAIFN